MSVTSYATYEISHQDKRILQKLLTWHSNNRYKNVNVKINPMTTKKCFSIILNQENGKIIIKVVRVDLYVSYTT